MLDQWHAKVLQLAQQHNVASDPDWQKTERLKSALASVVGSPPVRGLTPELFEEIVQWKLRRQRARTEAHRQQITADLLQKVTVCAFAVTHNDRKCCAKVRLKLLSALPGVGLGLASSIMTLTSPVEYGVIDYRVWKVVFGQDRRQFSESDYIKYLFEIWQFSAKYNWPAQKVDYFTWLAYDK
jgi:hypothetical protein